MSLYARIAALIVIVLALAGAWWKFDLTLKNHEQIGYDRRAAEDKAAADAQTARMRDLQRAAELRYVVQGETRDRYFVTTVKEIRDAAAPLAACPVPPDVVRLLNDAAECAAGDSAASCGAAGKVPGS